MLRSTRLLVLSAGMLAAAPHVAAQGVTPPSVRPGAPPSAHPNAPATVAAVPTLGSVLDTASLRVALAALPPHSDPRRGARILTIGFDTAGQPTLPRPAVEVLMSAATRDTLVALVRARTRPIAPRARSWETHLLLETGDSARVEEVVLDRRNASLEDRGRLTRRLETIAAELLSADEAFAGRELEVQLRLTITAEGVVEAVSVILSSGLIKVDDRAVSLVRSTRFLPALVEGEPVRATVVLPVRFVFEE